MHVLCTFCVCLVQLCCKNTACRDGRSAARGRNAASLSRVRRRAAENDRRHHRPRPGEASRVRGSVVSPDSSAISSRGPREDLQSTRDRGIDALFDNRVGRRHQPFTCTSRPRLEWIAANCESSARTSGKILLHIPSIPFFDIIVEL